MSGEELLVDATDAPCPRCSRPLGGPDARGVHPCVACGGGYADHAAVAALVTEEQNKRADTPFPPSLADKDRKRPAPEREVRYLRCPMCNQSMSRINFGARSAIILDVCKAHGTWFDRDELEAVLDFVARGGLEKERAAPGDAANAQRIARAQALMMAEAARETSEMERDVDLANDLLSILYWI